MDAMVLSAGAGMRMRPLTATTPKPLLKVGGRCLIEYHLDRLCAAGIKSVVINTTYGAEKFIDTLGDGSAYGVKIRYSHEADALLETGGGILNALPLIDSDPFLVISADVWTDYPFESLCIPDDTRGCLVLVDNPDHHREGDFTLVDGKVCKLDQSSASVGLTYSGISILQKSLISSRFGTAFPLRDVFLDGIGKGWFAGTYYDGTWLDIGTPDRLRDLDSRLAQTVHQ